MRKAALAVILNSELSSSSLRCGEKMLIAAVRTPIRGLLLITKGFSLLIMAWFFLSASVLNAAVPVIEKIEVEGLYSLTTEELLYLLDIGAGGTMDAVELRNGIKRAFLKGIFEDIQVSEEGKENILLRITVKEKDVIEEINVSGNDYLSDETIKSGFILQEGGIMRYDLIEKASGDLKEAFSIRGFPEAVATVSAVRTSKPYRVNIDLRINEGNPLLIREIAVQGAPLWDIAALMDTTVGAVYDRLAVDKDIEEIKKDYRDTGYLKPEVSYTFSDGRLELNIKAGKMLVVEFEGNSVLDTKTLMKEMPFFEAGEIRDDLIEEAYARLLALYHSKGYPYAQIAPVTKNISGEADRIEEHFFIYEGEEVAVGTVRFSGGSPPEDNLREIMALKEEGVYNPDLLSSDIAVIKEFYNALGYLSVHIEEPVVRIENARADILINIKEGGQTFVDSLKIIGAAHISEEEIRKTIGISEGDTYNDVDIADARYNIMDLYIERGFSDISVDVRTQQDKDSANIVFEINEGARISFGKTVITGNSRTRREVIERELLHRESTTFDYHLIARERQKLYKLGLFTDVNIEPLEKHNDRRDIHVSVAEGNAGAAELGIGYGDYEKFRAFADLSYRNLFGMNRHASLRAELSSLEERYALNYYEPWFLNINMPFRFLLLRENRTEKNIDTGEVSYRLSRYTAAAGVERKLGRDFKAELYYDFSFVNTYDVKPDVILSREDTGTLAISSIKPGIIYDTRDNPFEPRRGIFAGLTMKAASGLIFSETDFVKIMFNANRYDEISRWLVLAVSFRGGMAQGLASTDELPLVERFFLGGRNTVRGYAQDTLGPKGSDGTPTGGNAFLMTNIELRTYLGKGLGIVAFLDGGNVWIKAEDMNFAFRYTAGLGMRYNTPVGPLRVDYGYKLMRESGESRGEVHFSIGHAF